MDTHVLGMEDIGNGGRCGYSCFGDGDWNVNLCVNFVNLWTPIVFNIPEGSSPEQEARFWSTARSDNFAIQETRTDRSL